MPSLAQLEEFKNSFKDVASQALIMSANPTLIEDYELPENEPPSPFPEELAGGPIIETEFPPEISDLGLDLPPESFTGAADSDTGFDFGDLLGSDLGNVEAGGLPMDEAIPGGADAPAETEGTPGLGETTDQNLAESGIAEPTMPDFDMAEPGTAELDAGSLDLGSDGGGPEPSAPLQTPDLPADAETDFSGIEFPDLDLTHAVDMGGEITDGASQTKQDESLDEPGLPAPETDSVDTDLPASEDFSADMPEAPLDLEGAEDFSFGEEIGGIESGGTETGGTETGEFDSGGFETNFETGGADFGTDSPIDFGTGDTSTDIGDTGTDIGDTGTNIGDTGADISDTGADFGTDLADIADAVDDNVTAEAQDITPDLGGTDSVAELPTGEEHGTESADSFDNFTAGDDWHVPDTPLETPDFNAAAADEFGDFSLSGFDDTGEAGKPGKARPAGLTTDLPDEVEEIRLSEDEFHQLQDTLSAYPLNLRIACEELIAEQAVAPDQMSALIKLLVRGAPAKETAALAGKILGKPITIPKGYAKQTGEDLESEQASFGYIFTRRFLPILRLAGAILLVTASLGYLIWRFAVIPLQAESRYKEGYTLLQNGEYVQANERFRQGFEIHRVKKWFYRYAEGFRNERQYLYAEQKYDELLRFYPLDKKGALDYAAMETYQIKNYEKADRILRSNILDYSVNDKEGLWALAENNLAWGETDYSRYEEARAAFARLIEKYGRKDLYLEGMLKFFIRTDQLDEVLPLQAYFMSDPKKRKITVPTLAELGGYLLDKRFEETEGVPDEYTDKIDGIRAILIRAINADRNYPESYYHLARYHARYSSDAEERQSLKDAIRAFSAATEETPRRITYFIDTLRRYAQALIKTKEFFPAEEELIRGVRLYEDARARGVLKTTRPEFGRLYASLGDLEFFVKSGNMDAALRFYEEAERNDYSPPEIQYRMGAAHFQNEQWEEALKRFFALTSVMPNNKRLLYALGNTAYLRGDYFAAQGYYNRLMDILDSERIRFPNIAPGANPNEQDLAERLMVADNNLGVTFETLTRISGDTRYRTRALYLFSESIRAWDVLTRNPESMARMQPIKDLYGPGINLAYLNTQNILHPSPAYELQIFMRIDRDCLEPSDWEDLVPRDYRLSDQLPIKEEL